MSLLDKAAGGELQLDGRSVSVEECKELIKRTKVLEGLDLFRSLGDWGQANPGDPGAGRPRHPPA